MSEIIFSFIAIIFFFGWVLVAFRGRIGELSDLALFSVFAIFLSLTILSFAGYYMIGGEAVDANGVHHNDFLTNLYFSIITFTTLGYGDFYPPKRLRLLAGFEALSGYIFMGIFIVLIWRFLSKPKGDKGISKDNGLK